MKTEKMDKVIKEGWQFRHPPVFCHIGLHLTFLCTKKRRSHHSLLRLMIRLFFLTISDLSHSALSGNILIFGYASHDFFVTLLPLILWDPFPDKSAEFFHVLAVAFPHVDTPQAAQILVLQRYKGHIFRQCQLEILRKDHDAGVHFHL